MGIPYENKIGRIRLRVSRDGALDSSYGHGCQIDCPDGWNDSSPVQTHTVSVEELHDLRYLINRALDAIDRDRAERERRRT